MNDHQNSIITSFGYNGRWQDAAWMISIPDSLGVAEVASGLEPKSSCSSFSLWPVSIVGEVAIGFMGERSEMMELYVGSENTRIASELETLNPGHSTVENSHVGTDSQPNRRRRTVKAGAKAPQSLPKAVKTKSQPTSTDP